MVVTYCVDQCSLIKLGLFSCRRHELAGLLGLNMRMLLGLSLPVTWPSSWVHGLDPGGVHMWSTEDG